MITYKVCRTTNIALANEVEPFICQESVLVTGEFNAIPAKTGAINAQGNCLRTL